MNQAQWTAVDGYINDLFVPDDDILEAALRTAAEAGLPEIQVTPSQGKLLGMMVQAVGARKVLEIGTLGGYSAIWIARALPSAGRLVTLEAAPKHAEVARSNFVRAGLEGGIDIRVGPAQETLPALVDEGIGPFDLVFIDADKPSYPTYFDWTMKLTRPGSLIILDNVVRGGAVADPGSSDPNVLGVRKTNAAMASDPRVTATAIQTVGKKGYDGFSIALVTG